MNWPYRLQIKVGLAVLGACAVSVLTRYSAIASGPSFAGESKGFGISSGLCEDGTCRVVGTHTVIRFDKLRAIGSQVFGVGHETTLGHTNWASVDTVGPTNSSGETQVQKSCKINTYRFNAAPTRLRENDYYVITLEMRLDSACKIEGQCPPEKAAWVCSFQSHSYPPINPHVFLPHDSSEPRAQLPSEVNVHKANHGMVSHDTSTGNDIDVYFESNEYYMFGLANPVSTGGPGGPGDLICFSNCAGSRRENPGWAEHTDNHYVWGSGSVYGDTSGVGPLVYDVDGDRFHVCMNIGLSSSPCQATPTPTPSPTPTPTPTPTPMCTAGTASLLSGVLPQCQQSPSWCWAASSQFVIEKVKGVNYSQCQIDEWGYNRSPCDYDDYGLYYHITSALERGGLTVDHDFGADQLTPAMIQSEIDAGHPIMVGVRLNGKLYWHSLIITGYECVSGNTFNVKWVSVQRCNSGGPDYVSDRSRLDEFLDHDRFTIWDVHMVH